VTYVCHMYVLTPPCELAAIFLCVFFQSGRVPDRAKRIGVVILSCQLQSTGEKPVASVAG